MRHIRPHRLFNLVQSATYEQRLVRLVLPDQRTPVLLESAVLLALAKLVGPRTYFEFGTFLGVETLNMAANLPADARVYTLDLDEKSLDGLQQDESDKPLTTIHMEMRHKLAFLGTAYEKKISRLYGDSKHVDFSPFYRKIDMVYVDGGHDLPTLIADTENAYKMLSHDHPACIAWHDYQNPPYPQVTQYLSALSNSVELFHVEESRIAFFLSNLPELAESLTG
jgi:Methyltransferase domain